MVRVGAGGTTLRMVPTAVTGVWNKGLDVSKKLTVKVSSASFSKSNTVGMLNRTTVISAGRMTVPAGRPKPPKSAREAVSLFSPRITTLHS